MIKKQYAILKFLVFLSITVNVLTAKPVFKYLQASKDITGRLFVRDLPLKTAKSLGALKRRDIFLPLSYDYQNRWYYGYSPKYNLGFTYGFFLVPKSTNIKTSLYNKFFIKYQKYNTARLRLLGYFDKANKLLEDKTMEKESLLDSYTDENKNFISIVELKGNVLYHDDQLDFSMPIPPNARITSSMKLSSLENGHVSFITPTSSIISMLQNTDVNFKYIKTDQPNNVLRLTLNEGIVVLENIQESDEIIIETPLKYVFVRSGNCIVKYDKTNLIIEVYNGNAFIIDEFRDIDSKRLLNNNTRYIIYQRGNLIDIVEKENRLNKPKSKDINLKLNNISVVSDISKNNSQMNSILPNLFYESLASQTKFSVTEPLKIINLINNSNNPDDIIKSIQKNIGSEYLLFTTIVQNETNNNILNTTLFHLPTMIPLSIWQENIKTNQTITGVISQTTNKIIRFLDADEYYLDLLNILDNINQNPPVISSVQKISGGKLYRGPVAYEKIFNGFLQDVMELDLESFDFKINLDKIFIKHFINAYYDKLANVTAPNLSEIQKLKDTVKYGSFDEKVSALKKIITTRNPEYCDYIAEFTNVNDLELKKDMVHYFGAVKKETAVDALKTLALDTDLIIQITCKYYLNKKKVETNNQVIKNLNGNSNTGIRLIALYLSQQIYPIDNTRYLVETLNDSSTFLQRITIRLIQHYKITDAKENLNMLINDVDVETKIMILKTLLNLGGIEDYTNIFMLLKSSNYMVTSLTKKYLEMNVSENLTELITQNVDNENNIIRVFCYNYLMKNYREEFNQHFIKGLNDDNNEIVLISLKSLKKSSSYVWSDEIFKLITNSNSDISIYASLLLLKFYDDSKEDTFLSIYTQIHNKISQKIALDIIERFEIFNANDILLKDLQFSDNKVHKNDIIKVFARTGNLNLVKPLFTFYSDPDYHFNVSNTYNTLITESAGDYLNKALYYENIDFALYCAGKILELNIDVDYDTLFYNIKNGTDYGRYKYFSILNILVKPEHIDIVKYYMLNAKNSKIQAIATKLYYQIVSNNTENIGLDMVSAPETTETVDDSYETDKVIETIGEGTHSSQTGEPPASEPEASEPETPDNTMTEPETAEPSTVPETGTNTTSESTSETAEQESTDVIQPATEPETEETNNEPKIQNTPPESSEEPTPETVPEENH